MKSHLDNDSCLPNLQDDSGNIQYSASNPLRTELHFPHFIMVITVLWAELWFVVAHCNLALSVGIVPMIIHDNLATITIHLGEIMSWMVAYAA